ncbi:MAG: hypothetical protein ABIG35_11875 [Pseudomonadota bacterium]
MTEFEEGALVAIGLIVATHDEPTIAASVLNGMGLCEADCSAMDDYDKANLAKLQGECHGKVKLRGLAPNVKAQPTAKSAAF